MSDDGMRNRLRPRNGYQPVRRAAPMPNSRPQPLPAQNQSVISSPSATNSAPSKSRKKLVIMAIVALIVVGLTTSGYFLLVKKHPSDQKGVLGESVIEGMTIPVYAAKNLPAGYSLANDAKVLKADIYYFSVTGPDDQVFHITQQPIPTNFNFLTFSKKFLNPDTFTANAGTVTAGPIGTSMIASIRTVKNTWIIINSSPTATLAGIETVARSLEISN